MSLQQRIPWIIKYRPKSVNDVVDQEEAKSQFLTWLEAWLKGRPPEKRAALLYGPPGVGKTSLVEAAAHDYKLEVLELNASDYRRAEDIRRTVGVAAFRRPLTGRLMIILMDEVDGISAKGDAGGLDELLRIIPNAQNPIVLTANDPWKDQLRPLREVTLMIEFKNLSTGNVVSLLQNICDREHIECDREALRYIADKNAGDVRACVNDLEAVAEGYGKVTMELARALVRGRDKSIDLWRTLNDVFYAKAGWMAKKAVTNSEEDYETIMAWLNDNIQNKYGDPEDAFRAWDALSRASLFLSRAKAGNWDFLSYVFDLMGPGVAMARQVEQSPLRNRYQYPSRITLMAKLKDIRSVRDSIAERLASRLHISTSTFKEDVLPYLFIIFRQGDLNMAGGLVVGYGLTESEVQYLAGPRSRDVLKSADAVREALRKGSEVKAAEGKGPQGQPRQAERGSKGQLTLDMFGLGSSSPRPSDDKGKRGRTRK
ncbi:Replication factor C large subunit [Acidilobus saccharovorans 345-15]|uniref:Replication factor C large subunit n=1 Tax=Acidilobus saccharovorans (strain DSM 16705 / JCM 18335 / VKM B-2471 / 345-15) TaxID=666510 RepID=D9Q1Z3_ACIS3|nr:replication factor C large subunit [Acidilobus saccharovorans]ADL19331.1 Replication factor C large subunit [Acidilobus saccharovorans 345-15]